MLWFIFTWMSCSLKLSSSYSPSYHVLRMCLFLIFKSINLHNFSILTYSWILMKTLIPLKFKWSNYTYMVLMVTKEKFNEVRVKNCTRLKCLQRILQHTNILALQLWTSASVYFIWWTTYSEAYAVTILLQRQIIIWTKLKRFSLEY